METMYLTHPACRLHEMGSWHPESPQRLDAISDQLLASGLMPYLDDRQAPQASRHDLLRVHTVQYLDDLRGHTPEQGYYPIDPDTLMNPHTYEAALYAAGAGVAAVDAVIGGEARTAFCAVRPPGHHACRTQAMGFCFLNNVAIAARHALEQHGLSRVAVVDFDVHHGNGTENILSNDPRVLMVGIFQHPFYPFSGTEHPAANMVNVPIPAYTKGMDVREMIECIWMPRLEEFKPQMLFVSAGFDAHREDELGQLGLNENDFTWITSRIRDVANRHAKGRIVSLLEGGYHLDALARSVEAHVRVLADL